MEADRRAVPRRRLRDRVASGIGRATAVAGQPHELTNLLLLIDDDLRETALALGGIEKFLEQALAVVARRDVTRDEVRAIAGDPEVLDRIDDLVENLTSLRKRLAQVAGALR